MKNQTDDALLEVFDSLSSEDSQAFLHKAHDRLAGLINRAFKDNHALVESAVELTDEEQAQITDLLQTITGNPMRIFFKTDSLLLGGLRITIGDWKLDGTLMFQLQQLAQHAAD